MQCNARLRLVILNGLVAVAFELIGAAAIGVRSKSASARSSSPLFMWIQARVWMAFGSSPSRLYGPFGIRQRLVELTLVRIGPGRGR